MLLPSQCRAARALLGWSQADLEARSQIAKRTIADFENGVRSWHPNTERTLQSTFEDNGVLLLEADVDGPGVRLRAHAPRLCQREDVPQKRAIIFSFEYRGERRLGYISYDALASIALDSLDGIEVFDRDQHRIVWRAADKVDQGEFDLDGRIMLGRSDISPIPFNSNAKLRWFNEKFDYGRYSDVSVVALEDIALPRTPNGGIWEEVGKFDVEKMHRESTGFKDVERIVRRYGWSFLTKEPSGRTRSDSAGIKGKE
ncbi:helix-turn-helix domain-containing protein [Taklimakanibacter deserti]|uniref:helix-turn-helix domain-containing protein n=1 Tax=Taklimakanibacter deserti TaxID=2267839 RepID=UPI000E647CFF